MCVKRTARSLSVSHGFSCHRRSRLGTDFGGGGYTGESRLPWGLQEIFTFVNDLVKDRKQFLFSHSSNCLKKVASF
ncbi:hypothetical protein CEXT_91901 [Caerostris extrusa]|uniref:Uncharacterized protein n=1 Tax=Caerostris extrusa TaxID=172846 RepID=A0AAV4M3Y3_CAEEX|nr:hypothetical protein CEXT_91901 [Caerostris extrusa]